MSKNPYKDYYEAVHNGTEWSAVDAERAKKRIERIKEVASLNGVSEEAIIDEMSINEMGG